MIKEGFEELKIRRFSNKAKFTTVSRAFVTSSSSSVNKRNPKSKIGKEKHVLNGHESRKHFNIEYLAFSHLSILYALLEPGVYQK